MFISCYISQMALLGTVCVYSFSEGKNYYAVIFWHPPESYYYKANSHTLGKQTDYKVPSIA